MRKRWLFIPLFLLVGALGGQLLAILLSFISAMKPSDWARQQGISDITAWRWFRAGKLPVPARPLPTGTIWVEAPHPEGIPVRYARVSSADQKEDPERQVQRLQAFAQEQGWTEVKAATEIGFGLNGSGSDGRGASRSAGPVRI
jgi:DNA invertase Pin-like site-specific DNA recombinase